MGGGGCTNLKKQVLRRCGCARYAHTVQQFHARHGERGVHRQREIDAGSDDARPHGHDTGIARFIGSYHICRSSVHDNTTTHRKAQSTTATHHNSPKQGGFDSTTIPTASTHFVGKVPYLTWTHCRDGRPEWRSSHSPTTPPPPPSPLCRSCTSPHDRLPTAHRR